MSGEESRVLADEQSALRRVATLMARGVPPEEVFGAVTEEVGRLLSVEYAHLGRYESDGTITFVAASGGTGVLPVGARLMLGGNNVSTVVARTGLPARIDSYADASGPVAVAARERGVRLSVGTPIVVEGRLWGVMVVGSTLEQPLPADTEARLASFTELLATAIANAESRAELAQLAEEQAALRRVATLVASGAPPDELFAAVVKEVEGVLPVDWAAMGRYESSGTMWTVATSSPVGDRFHVGGRFFTLGGKNISTIVAQTGRSARLDSYADASGEVGAVARERGFHSSVGTPIIVEGRLWGVIVATSRPEQPLPADTEARLASFTELVAMAIANADSRAELAQLAEEQAALRRVATLVARGPPPDEVFAAVTEEVGRLLPVEFANMCRYEPEYAITVVATWGRGGPRFRAGTSFLLGGDNLGTLVFETGRPARIDNYADASGPLGVTLRKLGLRSAVGTPITVEGLLWGMMAVGTTAEQPLLADTEARLANFTELVATAIANAESRAELTASRARIVAAADDTRRRIERDLHDGAQQQLVTLVLKSRSLASTIPAELEGLHADVGEVALGLEDVLDGLRELSRGIHPALLSRGGLGPALKTLARRAPIPVEVDVRVPARLPEQMEVAIYYVVAEALTNVAKHGQASVVVIKVDTLDGGIRVSVSDDGVGGADPSRGSGLLGLRDRVDALGATMTVTSPPGKGTAIVVHFPVTSE